MNRVWLPLHHVWTTDAGMSYFLGVLVVVLFIVFALAHLGLFERFLVDIAFSLMLISGAIGTHRSHFLTALIIALTLAGLIVHWLTMYLPSFRHPLVDAFFALACFASFVVVLILQVFRPGLITLHRGRAFRSAKQNPRRRNTYQQKQHRTKKGLSEMKT